MVVLAFAFLGIYAAPILRPAMPSALAEVLSALNWIVWLAFVGDLAYRAHLSGRPFAYVVRHPIDLLLVLLPMLRPLRVLRIFTATNYLVTRGGRFAIGRTLASALAAAVLLMIVAALAVLDVERNAPGSNIHNFGDAIWWAGVTITSVGYGDRFPVTFQGRAVAFGLMGVGLSLLGLITASVAAWFVHMTRTAEDEITHEIRELRKELAELRQTLAPEAKQAREEA